MVHGGCDFVAGIHPSRTWMVGSFKSQWWFACVHRLDLSLYPHPKQSLGNRIRNQYSFKGKIPSTRGSEEGQTHYATSDRTASSTHHRLSYSSPCPDDQNDRQGRKTPRSVIQSVWVGQEVQEDQLDTNSAYILFYQRRSIDFSGFMPDTTGKEPDLSEIDDEFESDFKKMCVLQWPRAARCWVMPCFHWLKRQVWTPWRRRPVLVSLPKSPVPSGTAGPGEVTRQCLQLTDTFSGMRWHQKRKNKTKHSSDFSPCLFVECSKKRLWVFWGVYKPFLLCDIVFGFVEKSWDCGR